MRTQRQVVDYALQRKALLADVHSGRVGVAAVCDASPYLLRAARFHGEPSDQTCPVCRKERLTQVSWIFGDALKHAAGSARRPDEIEQLANRYTDFTVYVVEVCRTCSWNHLVLSYVMGTGSIDGGGADGGGADGGGADGGGADGGGAAPDSNRRDRRRTAAE